MSTTPAAKLVEPGQGRTIMLYGVRFDDRVTGADAGGALSAGSPTPCGTSGRAGHRARGRGPRRPGALLRGAGPVLRDKAPPSEYDALAERYGLTIENDWIEELERTYGVKL